MTYKIINKWCIKNFTTYDAYLKCVKKVLNIKTNIPIYVSSKIIFFPVCSIRNYNCLWLNYYNIKVAYNDMDKTVVIFQNGERIVINVKIEKILKLVENVHKIISYKENIDLYMEKY